jgi:hypothetical protein
MSRDQVIHGFDEKCADLALGTNPEIDRGTIMPTIGKLALSHQPFLLLTTWLPIGLGYNKLGPLN